METLLLCFPLIIGGGYILYRFWKIVCEEKSVYNFNVNTESILETESDYIELDSDDGVIV